VPPTNGFPSGHQKPRQRPAALPEIALIAAARPPIDNDVQIRPRSSAIHFHRNKIFIDDLRDDRVFSLTLASNQVDTSGTTPTPMSSSIGCLPSAAAQRFFAPPSCQSMA